MIIIIIMIIMMFMIIMIFMFINPGKGGAWAEVETGLWDELEDQFVAGVGFSSL